jgi:thiol-disulfide isomerase/thioredoxin
MKFKLIPLLLLLPVCLNAQNTAFTIKGNIKNYRVGEKVYFMSFSGGVRKIDSTLITDGNFVFSGTVNASNEPEDNYNQSRSTLFVDHTQANLNFNIINSRVVWDMCTLYLEPGLTEVNIIDSAHNASIKWPRQNQGHYELDSIYGAFFKKLDKSRRIASEMFKNKFDEYLKYDAKQMEIFKGEEKRDMWVFIKKHPTSPASLYILKHLDDYYPDYDRIQPYFSVLSDELKGTKFGKSYGEMLAGLKNTRISASAPEFTMSDTNGLPVSLSSLKGKYVFIDFWASWCGPCRAENPNVVNAYNQYNDKNFTILGVSLDQKKDAWIEAIYKDHLNWQQVSDLKYWDNVAARMYSVIAIPQNFLLDPQGKIIAKNLFGRDLMIKLSEVLDSQK